MTPTPAKATKPVAPPSVPQLTADLDAGLRRLKLAAIRRTAPEVLTHRQDATLDPRGSAAHPGRDRTGRPGCLQHRQPAQGRRVPGRQDAGLVRRGRLLDPAEGVRLPVQSGMGTRTSEPGDHRSRRDGQVAHPDRARGSLPSTRDTRSATSPPPTSSKPSTAAWPTTPSARSSNRCCASI